jgi:DNA-binding NtrC family response regulator
MPIFIKQILCKMRIGLIMSRELCVHNPKNVLIVDNDLNQRLSLSLILKRAGYLVTTVGFACEALERLQTGNYNLTILDIAPIENRLTLLPSILRQYPHISVLAVTAKGSPETTSEINALGISAQLEKPVTAKSLMECVDIILKEPA